MKNPLYFRILEWANEYSSKGFYGPQISAEFDLSFKENSWMYKVFVEGGLFIDTEKQTATGPYCLSAIAVAQLLNYQQLQLTQRAGNQARRWAIAAITIGAIVGFIQIYFLIFPEQAPEVRSELLRHLSHSRTETYQLGYETKAAT